MKLTINKNQDEIVVIPEIFKNEKNPPKFIFRNPNSADVLRFLWGKMNIDDATYNCFLRFENKIELFDEKNNKVEYNTYEEFIKAGASVEIALIHNECAVEIQKKLNEMIIEAQETEKKLKSPLNSGEKDKQNTPKD